MSTMPFTTVSPSEPEELGFLKRVLTATASRVSATRDWFAIRENLRELRDLDEFMLRDIGASGDEIYRVHQLRNGDRPTLLVG